MVSKIIAVALLITYTHGQQNNYHQATSFSSFNDNHNSVHHIQSAPTLVKTAPIFQSAPVHSAPVYHTAPLHPAPVYKSSPLHISPVGHQQAQSYSSLSFTQHGGPAANAQPVRYTAPVGVPFASYVAKGHQEEEHAHPKYEFAYGVEDHHTGDIHSQKESRDGDFTQGEYSLHEADGTIRTVKYTVDKHSGFNAVVERSGHAQAAPQYNHH